jgi:hypothetical protein
MLEFEKAGAYGWAVNKCNSVVLSAADSYTQIEDAVESSNR